MRYDFIDICKSILIYFVVLGHSMPSDTWTYACIFWFHMPAFLIISGLFTRNKGLLDDNIKHRAKRILIPYMFFSLVLGTVARDGNIAKQFVGTLIGANGNITSYTFPYYFLTVLFFATAMLLFVKSLHIKTRTEVILMTTLYAVTHIAASLVSDSILGWIPWNLDMALFATVYLYIGYKLKPYLTSIRGGYLFIVIALLLITAEGLGFFHYQFSLKSHIWNWGLDILIPLVFLVALLQASFWVSKAKHIGKTFAYCGRASLCILLLHPFFIHINHLLLQGHGISVWLVSLINVAECTLTYMMFTRCKFGRIIIGEKP